MTNNQTSDTDDWKGIDKQGRAPDRRSFLKAVGVSAVSVGIGSTSATANRQVGSGTTAAIPWMESFEVADETTSDDGETAWQIENDDAHPDVAVESNALTVRETDGAARWRSEAIDISGVETIDLAVTVSGSGDLRAPPDRDLPAVTGSNQPIDPDEDGVYEDVDGDGMVDMTDANALLATIDEPAVAENPGAYDQNCNDRADYADVVALGQEARGNGDADSGGDCARGGDELTVAYVVDGEKTVVTQVTDVASDGETIEATGLSGEQLRVEIMARTPDPETAYHVEEVRIADPGPDTPSSETLKSIEAGDDPEKVYSAFNAFAKEEFGAESDDLMYEFFGDSLEFLEESGHDGAGSVWTYASTESAAVTFETSLPATSHVEYRVNGSRAIRRTATTERPFSVHVHYLTDLQPGRTYEWRPVAVDERGNERKGEFRTIETQPDDSLTPLSVDEDGEPAVTIDEPGEYVLTQDFTARRNAIEIHADDVTLDLGGHTVTYASIEVDPDERFDDPWYAYTENGSFGVWTQGHSNLTVVNGTVQQAETDPQENRGNKESVGFNPVMIRNCTDVEVAGIEADYHSPQNTGMRFRYPNDNHHIHHNVVRDRGTIVDNRDGGGAPMGINFLGVEEDDENHIVHHNLLARVRQNGLGGDTAFNNEIYGDSWATNSFMVKPRSGETPEADGYYNNRIYATGYNAYGFGWSTENVNVHDNVVSLYGMDTSHRWHETWGDVNLLAGVRITSYGDGGSDLRRHHYWDNLIVGRAKEGAGIEGTRFSSDQTYEDIVFRDSTVKAIALDDETPNVTPIVGNGQHEKESALPVYYRNNRLISNVALVRFGSKPYKNRGHNHNVIDSTFERVGDNDDFATVVFDSAFWSWDHTLRDNDFGEGTAFDDVYWRRTGDSSTYRVEWTLDLTAPAGADVTITDVDGETAFTGKAPADGSMEIPLAHCDIRRLDWEPDNPSDVTVEEEDNHKKVMKTPHTVEVSTDEGEETETVEMTEQRELDLDG